MEFHALLPYSTTVRLDNNGMNVFAPVIIGKNQTTYNYKTITGIQISSGIIFSDVTIRTINQALTFRFFKGEGKKFHQAILPNLNN